MATLDVSKHIDQYLESSRGKAKVKPIISEYAFNEIKSGLNEWLSTGTGHSILATEIASRSGSKSVQLSFREIESDLCSYLDSGKGSKIIREICEKIGRSSQTASITTHDVKQTIVNHFTHGDGLQLVKSLVSKFEFYDCRMFREAVEKVINDDKWRNWLFDQLFHQDRLKNLVNSSVDTMVPAEIKRQVDKKLPKAVDSYLDRKLPTELGMRCPETINSFCNQLVPQSVNYHCSQIIGSSVDAALQYQVPIFLQQNVQAISTQHSELFEQNITTIGKQRFQDFLTESSIQTSIDNFLLEARIQTSTQLDQQKNEFCAQLQKMESDIQSSVKDQLSIFANVSTDVLKLEHRAAELEHRAAELEHRATQKQTNFDTYRDGQNERIQNLEYMTKCLVGGVVALASFSIYLCFRSVNITMI